MIKWLLAFLHKHFKPAPAETQTEEQNMSEPLNDEVVQQPVVNNCDAVLAKLKELVAAAGAQTHAVFDDLVELAKKLV
jgi:hypothetical protein